MRLISQNRLLKGLHTGKAILWAQSHCFHGDVDEFAFFLSRNNFILRSRHQTFHGGLAGMRWTSCQNFIQNGSQQVNIRERRNFRNGASCHFRRHVSRGPPHAGGRDDAARFAEAGCGLCQSPVHDQNFTKFTEHDVFRLQIAVYHAAGMSKRDCVSNFHQNIKVFRQGVFTNGFEPGTSFDFFH